MNLKIDSFTAKDLETVPFLQPKDWPDIFPSIQYYCSSDFCYPLKATVNGVTAGMGTAIIYGDTAWLAHIIVHPDHRNAGIGTMITKSLIELIRKTSCQTILLIATALGEPVYKKVGFEIQSQYLFFNEGTLPPPSHAVKEITPFQKRYENELLALDRAVSGEERKKLLQDHLTNTVMFIENNALSGFYIPTLGEGLIVADSPVAGLELMKLKSSTNKKFCIPINNEQGINFLISNGCDELRRASRMILGNKHPWNGSKIYSRIGGNLG